MRDVAAAMIFHNAHNDVSRANSARVDHPSNSASTSRGKDGEGEKEKDKGKERGPCLSLRK
jgi:hypothetical protein